MEKITKWRCSRCLKYLSTKERLKFHLERKFPCKPVVQNVNDTEGTSDSLDFIIDIDGKKRHVCRGCDKTFAAKSGAYRHMRKSCKGKKPAIQVDESVQINNNNSNNTNTTTNNTNNITDNSINTNNNTLNQTNNTNFNLAQFGKEKKNPEHISSVLRRRGTTPRDDYVRMSTLKHLHPAYPENHNVYIPNINKTVAVVYTDLGFRSFDSNQIISQSISDNLYDLGDYEDSRYEQRQDELISYGNSYIQGRMDPEEKALLHKGYMLAYHDNTNNVLMKREEYEEYMKLKRQARAIEG